MSGRKHSVHRLRTRALQAKIHFSFIRVMVDAPYQEAARRMGLALAIGDGA